MFKIKLPTLCLIVLSVFLFSSCEYEAYEGDIPVNENFPDDPNNPDDPNDPDDPNNPDDPTGGSGVYWPLAVGNSWEFTDSQSDNFQTAYDDSPINITGTIDIDGQTFYKMPSFISIDTGIEGMPQGTDVTVEDNGGIRYSNGNYTQVVDFMMEVDMGGMTSTTHSVSNPLLFFKENVEAGDTWTETMQLDMTMIVMGQTQTTTQSTEYFITVDEKDVTATVNGQTFENVIKMTIEYETGEMMTHFWIAKDVGPIYLEFVEVNNLNDPSDDEWGKREIVSYNLN